ncbi:MAG TPA: DUF2778 domain-containing protein [Xanthobacteraceae bacterium]|jgi:hypothetical protein
MMKYESATFPEVTSFDSRISLGDLGRIVLCHLVTCLAAAAAIGVTASLVTLAAARIVAFALSDNPDLHTRAPTGLYTAALSNPYLMLADATGLGESALLPTALADASIPIRAAELQPAAAAPAAPVIAAPPPQPAPERTQNVPSPPPRPSDAPRLQAKPDAARPPAGPAAPQVAMLAPPPASSVQKPSILRQAPADATPLPDLDSHTAVYDIAAHTVYLPNGERLEAHSGLGDKLDDPRYVNLKDRGPTPPNVYDLSLRGELFHGVRAIRLNPVDENKTFGRDGILAHTYMLGPSGQSFGCVSFKDYDAFLHAFLKGEVARIVVVPHLGTAVLPATLASRG